MTSAEQRRHPGAQRKFVCPTTTLVLEILKNINHSPKEANLRDLIGKLLANLDDGAFLDPTRHHTPQSFLWKLLTEIQSELHITKDRPFPTLGIQTLITREFPPGHPILKKDLLRYYSYWSELQDSKHSS